MSQTKLKSYFGYLPRYYVNGSHIRCETRLRDGATARLAQLLRAALLLIPCIFIGKGEIKSKGYMYLKSLKLEVLVLNNHK